MIKKLRETFRPESSYKAFFVTIVTFALAHGLYKGIIDNYLAESVGMSAFDKGVSEFFREMPGLALIFVLALLYEFSAERIRIAGGIAETKAFSLLDVAQGKAVLKAAEDIAFWKVVSAGTAGDAPEAGHSFTIDDELAGDRLELRIAGRLDSLTAPRLLEVYEKREAAGRIRKVQADCHALDYISSAGVRVLVMMRKNCEEGVCLTGVNETVREILDQTGISGILDVRKS